MGKQSRKKTSVNKNIFTSGFVFSKVNAVMLVLFLIVEAIYYYIPVNCISGLLLLLFFLWYVSLILRKRKM